MPSLIDIRRRVRSVRNTQQITKAMKMISAARLRRAQERALAARPYGEDAARDAGERGCRGAARIRMRRQSICWRCVPKRRFWWWWSRRIAAWRAGSTPTC